MRLAEAEAFAHFRPGIFAQLLDESYELLVEGGRPNAQAISTSMCLAVRNLAFLLTGAQWDMILFEALRHVLIDVSRSCVHGDLILVGLASSLLL